MSDYCKDFYRGRKILVTGHTGFKGGWLTAWLKLLGAEVVGFALPPETSPNVFELAEIQRDIVSTFGDIKNLPALLAVFQRHNPEIVIHNAAQSIVRRSYREPVETYATNVMGTVHVLEAARHTPSVRSIVAVTSDKCYENEDRSHAYREEDAMGGHDPYSSSKGAAELVVSAYRRSFFSDAGGAAIASARAGNVIGGGDWSEGRLIPDIIRSISADQPVRIRQPYSIRPWQYVLEPIRGYLLLGRRLWEEHQKYAGAWNFGPREDDAIPVSEITRRVIALWGKGELEIHSEPTDPHEATYLRLNCEKSSTGLGWKPKLKLHEALEWTVEWYRKAYEKPNSCRSLIDCQIERYMSIANV